MQSKSHLIYFSRILRDGTHIIEFHSFFERIHAPTVAEALLIAHTRHPDYNAEPFDERNFLTTPDQITAYIWELVS